MSNIKSPIETWDYKSLYAIASDSKANKTIAHNTVVSLVKNEDTPYGTMMVVVSLHGNAIAAITEDNQVYLLQAALDWCTYTTQVRLNKIFYDCMAFGIFRHLGQWVLMDGTEYKYKLTL